MSETEQLNILASLAEWAWPLAVGDLFRPRGVNLLVAESPEQFVDIIRERRIHVIIVDVDDGKSSGLAIVRIIRMDYPLLPCILLSAKAQQSLLARALELNVFGVVAKPVDMEILRRLLDRLFVKEYDNCVFAK